jgi:hypothetical protein
LWDLLQERRKTSTSKWVFPNEQGDPEGHFLRKLKRILNLVQRRKVRPDPLGHIQLLYDVTQGIEAVFNPGAATFPGS